MSYVEMEGIKGDEKRLERREGEKGTVVMLFVLFFSG